MSEDYEQTRRIGGDLWEGATSRRASLRFVTLEALLIAFVVGFVAADSYDLSTPTAVAVGIIAFFAVHVILLIPVLGFVAGVAMSVVWGVVAFNFAFHLVPGSSMLLGIVVGVVVGVVILSLHLGFSR